jgi:4-hydroxybenzoyl-CoA thioesterase
MFINRRTVRVEWSQCDPAGIVFYPNYFAMFDHSTVLLIEAALGAKKHTLYETYKFGGYPSVETKARFILPTRYGDDVEIETQVTKLGRSSFSLQHRLSRDGALAVEGNETRVWVVRDPDRPGGFRAHPMPDEVIARFSGG